VVSAMDGDVLWGLKTFPEDGNECTPMTVTGRIDVPIQGGGASAVNAAITAATPNGNGTPTAAAVNQVTTYLHTRAATARQYILLVTDGIPTCAPNGGIDATAARTAAINQVSAAADSGIHTVVVGVGTATTTTAVTLNTLAGVGLELRPDPTGSGINYYAGSTRTELVTAISDAVKRTDVCLATLSAPTASVDNVLVS